LQYTLKYAPQNLDTLTKFSSILCIALQYN
jgi:hypothetical protein